MIYPPTKGEIVAIMHKGTSPATLEANRADWLKST
jgi:hypothetical protein